MGMNQIEWYAFKKECHEQLERDKALWLALIPTGNMVAISRYHAAMKKTQALIVEINNETRRLS